MKKVLLVLTFILTLGAVNVTYADEAAMHVHEEYDFTECNHKLSEDIKEESTRDMIFHIDKISLSSQHVCRLETIYEDRVTCPTKTTWYFTYCINYENRDECQNKTPVWKKASSDMPITHNFVKTYMGCDGHYHTYLYTCSNRNYDSSRCFSVLPNSETRVLCDGMHVSSVVR